MPTVDDETSEYRPFRRLGERLTQARLRAGYASQPQLARVMGVNHNTVCKHERGRVLPSPKLMKKYCELLRIDEAELAYGIGQFVPPPGSVVDYLLSRDAQALLDETRDRLLRVNWAVLSDGPIERPQVEVIARLIDRNLQRRGKSANVELSRSGERVSEGLRPAHS